MNSSFDSLSTESDDLDGVIILFMALNPRSQSTFETGMHFVAVRTGLSKQGTFLPPFSKYPLMP